MSEFSPFSFLKRKEDHVPVESSAAPVFGEGDLEATAEVGQDEERIEQPDQTTNPEVQLDSLEGAEKLTPVEKIGVFTLMDASPVTHDFAAYLTDEHSQHATSHESQLGPEDEGSLALREATVAEYKVIEEWFAKTFSESHAKRFGAEVHGIMMFGENAGIDADFAIDEWPNIGPEDAFPSDAQIVGWHGTNASRAVEIMSKGFKKVEEKKSGAPMYGDGSVYWAADSSKSMGYFHPGYYNDRDEYRQGGVMFLVRPKLQDKAVYVAGDALWGNRITDKDGEVDDWRTKYAAVYALSQKDEGSGYGRPNFREMCVHDPADVEIVAAVWVGLVPNSSEKYDPEAPVSFPTHFEEPAKASEAMVSEEAAPEFTSLEVALESLPYDGETRILKRTVLEPTGMCETADREYPYMGLELRRGDCVTFTLPDSQQGRVLDSLNVLHRKDRRYNGSVRRNVMVDGVFRAVSDLEGAYTRVYVFDENTKQWVFWPDPYKSEDDKNYGAKYAEPRHPRSPEVECLYDWLRAGKILPSHVVAMGWGVGDNAVTNFHGLEVSVLPPEGLLSKAEYVFTPGTRFVSEGMTQPQYGGKAGRYPDSVRLSSYGEVPSSLPENCKLDSSGNLHIVMTEPVELSRLEVACGDTHPDGSTLGWAKLTADVILHSQGGRSENLIKYQNVPPQGVLKGSPKEALALQVGDELVLRSQDDTNLYVMGVRLQ